MARMMISIGRIGSTRTRRPANTVDMRRRGLARSAPLTFGPGRERSGAPSVTPTAYVRGSC